MISPVYTRDSVLIKKGSSYIAHDGWNYTTDPDLAMRFSSATTAQHYINFQLNRCDRDTYKLVVMRSQFTLEELS